MRAAPPQGRDVPRFDRYILAQLLAMFAFFTLVLTGVMWVNRAVLLFNRLVAEGQPLGLFLEMSALALPNLIRLVVPVAAFVTVLVLTNRLSRDSEIVVVQAAGRSAARLMRPFVLFGIVAALVAGVLMHLLVPAARDALALREAQLARDPTAGLLREGVFQFPAEGISFYVRRVGADGSLDDVMIADDRTADERTLYVADAGRIETAPWGVQLVLEQGTSQRLHLEDGRLDLTRFAAFTFQFETRPAGAEQAGGTLAATTTLAILTEGAALGARLGLAPVDLVAELQRRTAQPVAAFVATLLAFGALMSAGFSRFGLWRRMALAVGLLIGFQLIETAALAQVALVPASWPLVWVAPAVGLGAVAVMIWLADRPRGFGRRIA